MSRGDSVRPRYSKDRGFSPVNVKLPKIVTKLGIDLILDYEVRITL